MLTYIEITVKDLDVTTKALIDTWLEVAFLRDFLLSKWEELPSDGEIKIEGVQLTTTDLDFVRNNVSIILGTKILNIPLVLSYNYGYDVLLGNDFLK